MEQEHLTYPRSFRLGDSFFEMILTGIADNHGIYDYRDVYSTVDVLIHSGDLFGDDTWQSEEEFVGIIKNLQTIFPNAKIIIVPGNHDYLLERYNSQSIHSLFGDDLVMLVDELFEFCGLKFYGNPHTPLSMAFPRRGNFNDIDKIPRNLDVLITHETPRCLELGCVTNYRGSTEPGCLELYKKVLEVKPRYHLFGHIHEYEDKVLENIHFINCSQSYHGKHFKPNITLLDIKPVEP